VRNGKFRVLKAVRRILEQQSFSLVQAWPAVPKTADINMALLVASTDLNSIPVRSFDRQASRLCCLRIDFEQRKSYLFFKTDFNPLSLFSFSDQTYCYGL